MHVLDVQLTFQPGKSCELHEGNARINSPDALASCRVPSHHSRSERRLVGKPERSALSEQLRLEREQLSKQGTIAKEDSWQKEIPFEPLL
jgi:hypothetical protein